MPDRTGRIFSEMGVPKAMPCVHLENCHCLDCLPTNAPTWNDWLSMTFPEGMRNGQLNKEAGYAPILQQFRDDSRHLPAALSLQFPKAVSHACARGEPLQTLAHAKLATGSC